MLFIEKFVKVMCLTTQNIEVNEIGELLTLIIIENG